MTTSTNLRCGMIAHVVGEQFDVQSFEIEKIEWHEDKPRSITLYDADADEAIVVQPNDFGRSTMYTIDECDFGAYAGVEVSIEFSDRW